MSGITDKARARKAAIFPNQQSDPLIGAGRPPFQSMVRSRAPSPAKRRIGMVVSISGHHNNRMVPTSALLANRGSCVCHSKASQICFDVQQRAGNHGCGFPPRAE